MSEMKPIVDTVPHTIEVAGVVHEYLDVEGLNHEMQMERVKSFYPLVKDLKTYKHFVETGDATGLKPSLRNTYCKILGAQRYALSL